MPENLNGMSSSSNGSVDKYSSRTATKGLNNLSLHDRYMKDIHSISLCLDSQIRHVLAEAVDIYGAPLHLFIETFLTPDFYDLDHAC